MNADEDALDRLMKRLEELEVDATSVDLSPEDLKELDEALEFLESYDGLVGSIVEQAETEVPLINPCEGMT